MYSRRSNLILGFHGCDISEQQRLVNDISYFKNSQEKYDWLGHGMYFWENNDYRAMDFAKEKKKAGKLETPSVIGAVIDLGYCLDLIDSRGIQTVKTYYNLLKEDAGLSGFSMPKNQNIKSSSRGDKPLRYLDCAVLEFLHSKILDSNSQPFDSVRALFIEGEPIYKDAGFHSKTHIQLCIRNPKCIKGVFLPRS